MTYEYIDKISNNFAEKFDYDFSIKLLISLSFYEGALWSINSIWHPINEKPDFNSLSPLGNDIIAFSPNKGIFSTKIDESNFDTIMQSSNAIVWAYVRDFLPSDCFSQYENLLKDNFNINI